MTSATAEGPLAPEDFEDFWRAVHFPDVDDALPFDWQARLAARVANEGWPDMLDIPTGLGKTTALDIAVFNLALAFQDGRSDVPRRIFMIIDRRVVVDQSFEHARRIQDRLESAEGGILAKVASVLMPGDLARTKVGVEPPDPTPLVVGRMRGGVNWSWRWLDRPDQPAIIVGTIDQVGSRLLFGGYGVGRSLRSIDAALVGSDSLILIDEAHLATPFITTLRTASKMVEPTTELPTVRIPQVVVMSATNTERDLQRFAIDSDAELDHTLASQRLTANKEVHLLEARITKKRRVSDTAAVLASVGRQLGDDHDIVGIVCNTVAVARAAFTALERDHDVEPNDVVVITGRQRQVDRDIIWDRWGPVLEAGRDRHDGSTKYAVATQTIEVGADLDFSAMVIESASFDAVAQRLGRLNRQGKWQQAPAVVVHPNRTDDGDPVYGPARNATWEWLCDQVQPESATPRTPTIDLSPPVDMSPLGLQSLQQAMDEATQRAVVQQAAPTPYLFPWMLDAWVQTSPQPLNTPPLHPFLHGKESGQPSVEILWRHVGPTRARPSVTRRRLEASAEVLPPSPAETLEVPLWAARAWLSNALEVAAEVSDVESARVPDDADERAASDSLPTIVLRDGGAEDGHLRLRPGDRIVAPTWLGGCDTHGWNPESSEPVVDVADLAAHSMPAGRFRSRNIVLRLDPATLTQLLDRDHGDAEQSGGSAVTIRELVTDLVSEDGARPPLEDVEGALRALGQAARQAESPYAGELAEVTSKLLRVAAGNNLRTSVHNINDLTGEQPRTTPGFLLARTRASLDVWVEDRSVGATSSTGSPVSLANHQHAVGKRAKAFAEALGLPDPLVEAVTTAARLHDEGKREPRFQSMLNGGGFPPAEPLAKSGMDPSDRWAFRRAREQAGYPAGMRHENHSAATVHTALATHPDRDLITHLVASHHGHGRPLGMAVPDPDPKNWTAHLDGMTVELTSSRQVDWEQPARFQSLNSRFGPWGLALLEAIVRLADIGCSEEGS